MGSDSASHFRPDSVLGPSELCPQNGLKWTDAGWRGLPIRGIVLYEVHVGTFTSEGTFEAIITRLRELKDLGVPAIELKPVAHFRGTMNWGARRVEKGPEFSRPSLGDLLLHFRTVCQAPEINP